MRVKRAGNMVCHQSNLSKAKFWEVGWKGLRRSWLDRLVAARLRKSDARMLGWGGLMAQVVRA